MCNGNSNLLLWLIAWESLIIGENAIFHLLHEQDPKTALKNNHLKLCQKKSLNKFDKKNCHEKIIIENVV